MRTYLAITVAALMMHGSVEPTWAQHNPDRERARIPYRLGWTHMRAEAWEQAARSFEQAIDIDREFELAYYMLGRANMALKKYVEAVAAYSKCRDLYLAQAGHQFSNLQEAQRSRANKLTELDDMIRQIQAAPVTAQRQEQMRQLQERRQRIQDAISSGYTLTLESTVPPWVSLALGSAYFRAERFVDAEREFKATIAADPKTGEAHNNLAVVYLETRRFDEAEKAVKAAEKAGFKVNPMLKDDIKAKKSGS